MVSLSKYWRLVSLNASGQRKIREIVLAKDFLKQRFADLNTEVEDSLIQRDLWDLTRDHSQSSAHEKNSLLARFCLRCYISHQIEQVCIQLEQQFGREYAFNRYDLFPLVLDDPPENFRLLAKTQHNAYQPLAEKILETFNPQKASLSTWSTRLAKQHRELNSFLLARGIYLISNWAILNDTSDRQLQRILAEFHNLTEAEISQARGLLASYHAIYGRERLRQRQAGTAKGKCQPPSEEQLAKIALLVEQKTAHQLTLEATRSQLQELATLLREYRLYVRGGKTVQQSLDAPETNLDRLQVAAASETNNQPEQSEFLQAYRQQLISCLLVAIAAVVEYKYARLAKKNQPKGQHYLMALDLFHCQGKSMGEIAPLVDLTAQYQVTRLLKLKELRVDIRQKLLQELRRQVLALAGKYNTAKQLQNLDAQLEAVLSEPIDVMIQEAETEASIAKERACSSLFSRQLCQYLKTRKERAT